MIELPSRTFHREIFGLPEASMGYLAVLTDVGKSIQRLEVVSGNSQQAEEGAAMGLDMYLTQRVFPASDYKIELTIEGKRGPVDTKRLSYIALEVGYWRKANAVHKWFVDNCQDGHDACQEVMVSYAQLQELRTLCVKVIETRNHLILPPEDGCFFGSTEADEYYFGDLAETIRIIDALDPEGTYYYESSW